MKGQDRDFSKQDKVTYWKDFIASALTKVPASYKKTSREVCVWAHTGGTTSFPKTVLLSDNAIEQYQPNHIMAIPAYVEALLEQHEFKENALSGL